jgi:hypothetical protein
MSTRRAGSARRKFITGIRLCPPARILASPPLRARRSRAASREAGAWYSNGAGFMPRILTLSRGESFESFLSKFPEL